MNTTDSDLLGTPENFGRKPVSNRRRRPFGLYMILILLTLQALIGVFLAAALGVGVFFADSEVWSQVSSEILSIGSSLLLLPVTAVIAVGLWRYRPWAWYSMMLLLTYYMASDAIGYFEGEPDYVSMLMNVAMVFYLNQHEVRDLFDKPASSEVHP